MAINVDKAFEVGENGFAVSDDDGNIIYYQTGGSGPPYGQQAPEGTRYIDFTNNVRYRKRGAGTGVDDWPFDIPNNLYSSADAGAVETTKILEVFDDVGGQAVAVGPTTLVFPSTRDNSDTDNYLFPNPGQIEFVAAGDYFIETNVSFLKGGGNSWFAIQSFLELDTGGGFNVIPGAVSYVSLGSQGSTEVNQGTASFDIFLPNVAQGDLLRCNFNFASGVGVATTDQGCSLVIKPAAPKVDTSFLVIDAGDYDGNPNQEPASILDAGEL